jgi:hypothetical protein
MRTRLVKIIHHKFGFKGMKLKKIKFYRRAKKKLEIKTMRIKLKKKIL